MAECQYASDFKKMIRRPRAPRTPKAAETAALQIPEI